MAFEAWKERAEELEAEVHALYLAFRTDRTPRLAKIVVALVVAFAVSPIDPIPDFVPGLGYFDDLVLLPVGVANARRLIPEEIMEECRERAGDEIDLGRARWLMAGIVLLAWFMLGLLAIRTFTNWL